jgi:uncharacterized protein YjbJ (UPF0337 family)
MDKDRVKGAIDQVVGNVKHDVGEVIGDQRTQDEGTCQEIKGEFETAAGELKDAARKAAHKLSGSHEANEEANREKRHAKLVEDHNLF